VRVCVDTSAFIKRFVKEPGSDRVLELVGQADALGVSVFLLPEVVSTLRRLVRERRLGEDEYQSLKPVTLRDLSDADVWDLTPATVARTVACLERNALRTLDALHIGCALVYRPDQFVSADRRQIAAARREGLTVEDVTH
jgi:predicted nucleic acid-binding protein